MNQEIDKSTAQKIVDTVKDFCGYDINFIDTNGYIYASTNSKRIGDYHEIGKRAADTGTLIEVDSSDNYWGTQPGVNDPFIYNNKIVAVIGITGQPSEVRKYSALASRITQLILREHEIANKNIGQRTATNYIIRSLVNAEPINMQHLADFMYTHSLKIEANYRTAIIQINPRYNPANLNFIENDIYETLEQIPQSIFRYQYPTEYVLIFEIHSLKRNIQLLQQLLDKYSEILKIAIGSEETIFKQNHSYQAASISLKTNNNSKKVAIYDDFDLEILLGSISENIISKFTQKTISHLSDEEKHILKVYYSNNMSLKAASEELFIHKNTLQYRLDRIYEKSGYNPREFKDAMVLNLALEAANMHMT